MNRREAYNRAVEALDAASEESTDAYCEHGEGWGAMASIEIYNHIKARLAFAFGQGPEPEPLTTEGGEE
jgi:hypothetical protein